MLEPTSATKRPEKMISKSVRITSEVEEINLSTGVLRKLRSLDLADNRDSWC